MNFTEPLLFLLFFYYLQYQYLWLKKSVMSFLKLSRAGGRAQVIEQSSEFKPS
jgi:hypothetical protein